MGDTYSRDSVPNSSGLTPVYAPASGELLGYRDRAGREYDKDRKPLPTGKRLPSGYGAYLSTASKENQDAASVARGAETQAQVDERNNASDPKQRAEQAQLASLNQDVAWLDGKRIRFVGFDPDSGAPTYTLNNAGNPAEGGTPYQLTKPTAYGALEAGDLADQNTRFVMSRGMQMFTPGTQPTGQGWDTTNGAYARTTGTNYMTIGSSLTWLAALSLKDPETYKAMVDKLHKASYLTDAQYAATGGGYSSIVGAAFARAGSDVSVVNGQGSTLSLPEYLDQRSAGNDALAADGSSTKYTPVERKYTDPEDIKANAKTVAEQTLGRQLTDAEEAQLTGHFHSLEDAAYDMIDRAKGKSYRVTPPGQGQIDAYVDGPAHEQEAADYRAAGYGLMLKQLFGLN